MRIVDGKNRDLLRRATIAQTGQQATADLQLRAGRIDGLLEQQLGGREREVLLELVTTQPRHVGRRRIAVDERGQQRRLPDARRPLDDNDLGPPGAGRTQPAAQCVQLLAPPGEHHRIRLRSTHLEHTVNHVRSGQIKRRRGDDHFRSDPRPRQTGGRAPTGIRAPESAGGDGEGGQRLDQRLTVLVDLCLAHQDVFALLADLRMRAEKSVSPRSQIRDRQLRRGRDVVVIGPAPYGCPHRDVDQGGHDATVHCPGGVQVSWVDVELGPRLTVVRRHRSDTDRVSESCHPLRIPPKPPQRTRSRLLGRSRFGGDRRESRLAGRTQQDLVDGQVSRTAQDERDDLGDVAGDDFCLVIELMDSVLGVGVGDVIRQLGRHDSWLDERHADVWQQFLS